MAEAVKGLPLRHDGTSGHKAPASYTYIDLFAGCGGLSLGLKQAGWEGLFAVERNPMAFETLNHNLIAGASSHFPHWPEWLPKKALSIQSLTDDYADKLRALRGRVMLIAGGPPCQGFSSAGKRQKNDHRNKLYKSYIEVVKLVRPALILLENVTGMKMHFGPRPGKKKKRGRPPIPYSERLKQGLEAIHYKVFDAEVLASDFGVPQTRTRFVAVGIDTHQFELCPIVSPFSLLPSVRKNLLKAKGLPINKPVSAKEALEDLIFKVTATAPSPDTKGFLAGKYTMPETPYQTLMRGDTKDDTIADSHRFVNHTKAIVERFTRMLAECQPGKKVSAQYRAANDLNKVCIVPMAADQPAATLTTIPDDMIHYSQPRVLTVRECARLQSFPDWFQFKSKYTTGGKRRKVECPRYTQVGNAVPPLLGEALGRALKEWISVARLPEQEVERPAA
jgi:DNA (cytosine-5)-methyltransferase 1